MLGLDQGLIKGRGAADAPYFFVKKANQSYSLGGAQMTFDTTVLNYGNCYASNAFTPNVAGLYLITAATMWSTYNVHMYLTFNLNGTYSGIFGNLSSPSTYNRSIITGMLYLNGTTDTVTAFAGANGSVVVSEQFFQGALIQAA